MANFTALAAARHQLLAQAGWDVERTGLFRAPHIRVLAGREHHDTIDRALRFLGLGTDSLVPVASDLTGRMRVDDLERKLAERAGPTIVCAQAGGVNGGSIDPLAGIIEVSHRHQAWVHVDGAFGLWAAASATLREEVAGIERADSWATDAHKWLNVPYDSGWCSARIGMRTVPPCKCGRRTWCTLMPRPGTRGLRPRVSRRARGFAVYAALRTLGRRGIAEVVDRCCGHARRFGQELGGEDDVELLAPVSLNQVLVRFLATDGDHDAHTRAVVAAVQAAGRAGRPAPPGTVGPRCESRSATPPPTMRTSKSPGRHPELPSRQLIAWNGH